MADDAAALSAALRSADGVGPVRWPPSSRRTTGGSCWRERLRPGRRPPSRCCSRSSTATGRAPAGGPLTPRRGRRRRRHAGRADLDRVLDRLVPRRREDHHVVAPAGAASPGRPSAPAARHRAAARGRPGAVGADQLDDRHPPHRPGRGRPAAGALSGCGRAARPAGAGVCGDRGAAGPQRRHGKGADLRGRAMVAASIGELA